MPRVLVTGAAGNIGTRVVSQLATSDISDLLGRLPSGLDTFVRETLALQSA
jgi:uncharacterized protein YbjT (DUF2867 family)